ncbi:hypothetical protein [Psychromonas sp. SA13A]|uniref:hypothetical protein n=1 Tax=Psychromonas sp. SA13A TaxID=2686346 RepID=UPI001408F5E6|nr:hypothetical protein [Psychromonas sp. SA13A]
MKKSKLFTFEGQDLERSFKIDPFTDKKIYSFTLGGNECISKNLDDKIAESLGRYALIDKDLDYIIRSVNLAIAMTSDNLDVVSNLRSYQYIQNSDELKTIPHSLFSSAVVAYGKCFASAEGRGIKLDKVSVFENANRSLLDTHSNIIDTRNNYIAHAGNTFMENHTVQVVYHPDKERNISPFISVDTDFISHVSQSTFKKYMVVFEHVSAHVKNKMNKIYEKIKQEKSY